MEVRVVKRVGAAIPLFMLCCLVVGATTATAGSYYKEIQKRVVGPIPDKEFEKLESAALKDFTNPELERQLALAFAPTSEKIWAIIYGEAYCLLVRSEEQRRDMGARLFTTYDATLVVTAKGTSVSMCTRGTSFAGEVPFETQYEMSFLMSSMPFVIKGTLKPLTIRTLTQIRQQQLRLWKEKGLPETELAKWLGQVVAAGHFEAYNYWLFQDACPRELETWKASSPALLAPWLEWLQSHPFQPGKPDFHRIYAR
jgi:hypothetical protein